MAMIQFCMNFFFLFVLLLLLGVIKLLLELFVWEGLRFHECCSYAYLKAN